MSHWLLPKRGVETNADAVKLYCFPQVSLAWPTAESVVLDSTGVSNFQPTCSSVNRLSTRSMVQQQIQQIAAF